MLTENVVSEGNNMFFRAKLRFGWSLKKPPLNPLWVTLYSEAKLESRALARGSLSSESSHEGFFRFGRFSCCCRCGSCRV